MTPAHNEKGRVTVLPIPSQVPCRTSFVGASPNHVLVLLLRGRSHYCSRPRHSSTRRHRYPSRRPRPRCDNATRTPLRLRPRDVRTPELKCSSVICGASRPFRPAPEHQGGAGPSELSSRSVWGTLMAMVTGRAGWQVKRIDQQNIFPIISKLDSLCYSHIDGRVGINVLDGGD